MKIDVASFSVVLLVVAGCASSTGTSTTRGDAGPIDASRAPDSGPRVDAWVEIPDVCGDGYCGEETEDCETCSLDCGECPTCDLAPTCTGALAVPTSTEPLTDLDNTVDGTYRTNYACGSEIGEPAIDTSCTDPQLRIRIRETWIDRGFWALASNLYCVISAEDGAHSELLITTPREVRGNGETTINFRPSEALLWGQGDLHRSIANITITYQCFVGSNAEDAMAILDDISDRAAEVAEHADGYGWVFGTASIVGTIIGSSLSSIHDDAILDVQQTIDRAALLEMTNGRTWEIRNRQGDFDWDAGAFDIRLSMEAWGCATVRETND